MANIIDIEKFFNTYDFGKCNSIKLSEAEVIVDLQKFVKTNIHLLKSNKGNKTYIPYWNRLFKAYTILKNK